MISDELCKLTAMPYDDIDEFYVVTLWKGRLELQGNLNRKTLEIAKNLDVTLTWNANTMALEGKNNNIRMCLTADL
jgi:hypothetical protein